MTNLIIVESPTKAKKIQGFLGVGWTVKASLGHIMQVADVGKNNIGVDFTTNDVKIHFTPRKARDAKSSGGKETIAQLRGLAEKADKIYLASDPDREGESISHHLYEEVVPQNKRSNCLRITYTEITEAAIKKAIANARQIDTNLVEAQFARQATDRVTGYEISPLVIEAGVGRSAGRVQSPALRIVCDREKQIRNFKPVPYWAIFAQYGEGLQASYVGKAQAAQVDESDFPVDDAADPSAVEEDTGTRVSSQHEADAILAIAQSKPHQVIKFEGKKASKTPPAPLTTSALQQVASVKMGLAPEQTMKIAQKLFEEGKISYHRTDSVSLSPEFSEEVKAWLQQHKPNLVPDKVTGHKDKAGSQGAHEAIRPTHVEETPEQLKGFDDLHQNVYALIWQRAIASQCAPAQFNKSVVQIQSGSTFWVARGSVMLFPGYTEIWKESSGDSELPILQEGSTLKLEKAWHEAKKTSPPGRFSEARLIQVLERYGIGRPSTYATIMGGLKDRGYVKVEKKNLVPTETGLKTDEFVGKVFPQLVDTKFTAGMEKQLDEIAEGKRQWKPTLLEFYFKQLRPALDGIGQQLVQESREYSDVKCPECARPLVIKRPKDASKMRGKDHYLKCLEGCEDVILFWNVGLASWIRKGDEPTRPAPKPGEATEFACQVCSSNLEIYRYQKEGQDKAMMRCSDFQARCKPNHKNEVYFLTSKGEFWNPNTGLNPSTEKGAKPAVSGTKPASSSKKKSKGKVA